MTVISVEMSSASSPEQGVQLPVKSLGDGSHHLLHLLLGGVDIFPEMPAASIRS